MDEPPLEHLSGPRPGTARADTSRADAATLATVLLCGVVVGMGAVASARGWIPTGDDAFLSLRTRHLFGAHPILLNNASSAGPSAGSQYNHPGAFPLTLLAPITMLGGPGSIALATAVFNAAWIAAISVMTRRIAGRSAQLVALVTAATLVWSMGATFLVDPWNPNFGVWPVAAMVVAAWGARQGRHRLLAVAVLAASVAFQTHLSLTVLSAAVAGWALLGVLGDWYTASRDADESDRAAARRPIARALLLAVVVGAVANAQMLADEVFGSGNLSKILEGTGFKEATVTVRQIVTVLASKAVIPPMWLRGSWAGPVLRADLASVPVTIVAAVVVLVLTAVAVARSRRRVPVLSSLFGVLAVAFVSATLVATKFPLRIGIPLPYFRWVWPLAAIWAAAILTALVLAATPRTGRAGVAVPVAVGLVVVLAGAALVPANRDVSPNPEWAQRTSRVLSRRAIAATRGHGPVVMDQSIQEAALWVIPALIDQLDAAGVEVRASDAVLVQQTDDAYRARGDERWHLVTKGGLQIDDAPAGSRLLARRDALTSSERDELDALVEALTPAVERPGAVRLTAVGRSETDAADLRHLTTGELPAPELLRSVPLRLALERGAVVIDGAPRSDLMRATQLGALDGGRSIALYLVDGRVSG
ncbi:MAG: hypothetical protein U0Q22_07805 [Acidimicrobiales bacterium]